MTSINTINTGSAPPTAGAGSQTQTGLNQLDNTQTFLNLLVAQLKNQDPSNPANPTSFMTEIAQLTAVQSQTTLNAEEQTVAADSMIGRSVMGNGSGGQKVDGTVTGVVLGSSGPPTLQITGANGVVTGLPLDAVTKVYTATAAATGPTSSSSSSSATGSTSSTTGSTTGSAASSTNPTTAATAAAPSGSSSSSPSSSSSGSTTSTSTSKPTTA